jgi:hypothetical protein
MMMKKRRKKKAKKETDQIPTRAFDAIVRTAETHHRWPLGDDEPREADDQDQSADLHLPRSSLTDRRTEADPQNHHEEN